MKLFLSAASAAFLVMAPALARAAALSDFIGHWKVDRIAGSSDPGQTDAGGKGPIGTDVTISGTGIDFSDNPCSGHPVTYGVGPTDRVLKESWETTRSALRLDGFHLGRMAGHIDATCADALVLTRNELLMPGGNGYFYLISRVTPRPAPAGPAP